MKIVLPGGSGRVGRVLARHFHAQGHEVIVFGRFPAPGPWRMEQWDGRTLGEWARDLDGADVVINLTGRNVNCRYSRRNRQEILESRVLSTRVIGEAIARAELPPPVWLNASTATIYRHTLDRPMDELSGELGGNEPDVPSSWAFSIEVAKAWESGIFAANTPRTRRIALRSAVIMSPDRGGIFDTLLWLVRCGLGGPAASGQQYISWMHDADFIAAIEFLTGHPELDGVVNLSSPNPLPQWQFMHELRHAWGTIAGLPASRWLLEIGAFLMRTETELVLKSRRVIPERLLNAGFEFQFPEWSDAARNLVDRWRASRLR
jgi:hypothetical protein